MTTGTWIVLNLGLAAVTVHQWRALLAEARRPYPGREPAGTPEAAPTTTGGRGRRNL